MIFTRLNKASRPSSAIAMALVLAATGAVGLTALEAPAHAQKKKKKEDEAPKQELSKAFLDVYQQISALVSGETPDNAAAKAKVPELVATIQSADEKNVGGRMLLSIGYATEDEDLRAQAMKMMLDSGKGDATLNGQLNFGLYQIYRDRGDIANARTALEQAIATNYSFDANMSDGTSRAIGPSEMHRMIAELYFNADRAPEGVAYLSGVIDGLRSSGQPVPETMIRSALSEAYKNDLAADSTKLVALLTEFYPTSTTWGDAIIITLNANDFANPDSLDLLRLSRRLNVYNDKRVLSEYVELLDSRRYPGEVVAAIDAAYTLPNIDKTDTFLNEARKDASGRLAADRRELQTLAKEARAANADLKTLVVAGDTFLSYDQPADAEEFYTRALSKPGVETAVVQTRLGIAQFDQGKYAEAIETLGKVQGPRRPIANLWAILAAQKMAPAAAAEATM